MSRNDVYIIEDAYKRFPYFIEHIFFCDFEDYNCPQHLKEWAKEMQVNKYTVRMSARRHLKSTLVYAYIMWKVFTNLNKDIEILYISYNEDLARYHTSNIKKLIKKNRYFDEIEDSTTTESVLKLKWKEGNGIVTIEPAGVNSFKRGRHPDLVFGDDLLADPTNLLDPKIIIKINKTFFEDIMSLPKANGELHVVGTPQTNNDLFFLTKGYSVFYWVSCPAIINYVNKEVLWPELFSYDKLISIRDHEIGEKAFSKEYMCVPVYTADAFFKREEIMGVVNPEQKASLVLDSKRGLIFAGFDIGKHAHPSHLAVFMLERDKLNMIYHKFLDGVDYNKQMQFLNEVVEMLGIDALYYDNTRGEFESSFEQGLLKYSVFKPIRFDVKTKHSMATELEKRVKLKTISLINDSRLLSSLLSVTNDLDSQVTEIGHGDAFWSVGLACLACAQQSGYGDPVILGYNIN